MPIILILGLGVVIALIAAKSAEGKSFPSLDKIVLKISPQQSTCSDDNIRLAILISHETIRELLDGRKRVTDNSKLFADTIVKRCPKRVKDFAARNPSLIAESKRLLKALVKSRKTLA